MLDGWGDGTSNEWTVIVNKYCHGQLAFFTQNCLWHKFVLRNGGLKWEKQRDRAQEVACMHACMHAWACGERCFFLKMVRPWMPGLTIQTKQTVALNCIIDDRAFQLATVLYCTEHRVGRIRLVGCVSWVKLAGPPRIFGWGTVCSCAW